MAEVNVQRRMQQPAGNEQRPRRRVGWWTRWPTGPTGFLAPNPFASSRRLLGDTDRSSNWLDWPGFMSQSGESWFPSLEVEDYGGTMVVRVDLPGINQNDVKVEVNEGDLFIHGERKREHEEHGRGFYRSERSYGSFSRCIPLPEGARADQARAQFNNGVLEVSIPVPDSDIRARTIPIESGERR
jgi:HSP20 family protein